ncbi:MAG TPA: tetratricopeptide repeat protein [Thermoanaerobaculia bacterium]
MSEEKKPRPRRSLALSYARLAEDVTQKELSERSGIEDISILEKHRAPDAETMGTLFAALDRRLPEQVDTALFCADLMRPPAPAAVSPVEPTPDEARTLQGAAALEAVAVFDATFDMLIQDLREEKARVCRREAEALFKDLMKRPAAERWRLVEEQEVWRSWALAERTAFASAKLAAHDADAALDLARLAVRMAELTPGGEAWRSRVGGICWGFFANAERVKGDFPASDQSFLQSDRLWKAGAVADPGLILDGTRLLDLKASLRRYQGRYEESLSLLAEALSACRSPQAAGRILLQEAVTLEQMGDWQHAIEKLQQAEAQIDAHGDPRLLCVVNFSLGVNFCNAGRYVEAEEQLPKVRRLAIELGNGLDLLRCRWLQGTILAGQGNLAEAVADLEAVAGELVALVIAFDAAQACLDLAELYLRQGRTAEVKRLAGQIVAVFKAQGVHREALAAVILFQEAAEQERATVELARKLSEYLRRAQHNPDLHFEP